MLSECGTGRQIICGAPERYRGFPGGRGAGPRQAVSCSWPISPTGADMGRSGGMHCAGLCLGTAEAPAVVPSGQPGLTLAPVRYWGFLRGGAP